MSISYGNVTFMDQTLTDRERELFAMPSVMSQLPIVFKSGLKPKVTEYDCDCTCCDETIPREAVHGLVSYPIPSVAVIEAVGYCPDCYLFSRALIRFRDDQTVTLPTDEGWRLWVIPTPLRDRVRTFFRRCFPG